MGKTTTNIGDIVVPATALVAIGLSIATGVWRYSRLETRVEIGDVQQEKLEKNLSNFIKKIDEEDRARSEEERKFREQVLTKLGRIEGRLGIESNNDNRVTMRQMN